jgi:hypothetical protein
VAWISSEKTVFPHEEAPSDVPESVAPTNTPVIPRNATLAKHLIVIPPSIAYLHGLSCGLLFSEPADQATDTPPLTTH